MYLKRKTIILAFVITIVFSLTWFFGGLSKPRTSMGLLGYSGSNNPDIELLCALVRLENNGSVTVRYDLVGSDELFMLRTESQTGWSSNRFCPSEGLERLPSLLAPGSNTTLHVYLPEGTLRWQVKYIIHKASIQSRIGNKFKGHWGERLYRLSGNLGLTNEGPPQVFWSEVYEVQDVGKHEAPIDVANRKRIP